MPKRAESQVTLTSSYGSVMAGPGMEKVGGWVQYAQYIVVLFIMGTMVEQ